MTESTYSFTYHDPATGLPCVTLQCSTEKGLLRLISGWMREQSMTFALDALVSTEGAQ